MGAVHIPLKEVLTLQSPGYILPSNVVDTIRDSKIREILLQLLWPGGTRLTTAFFFLTKSNDYNFALLQRCVQPLRVLEKTT